MDFKNDIKKYISCEIETLQKLDINAVNEVLNLLIDTAKNIREYIFLVMEAVQRQHLIFKMILVKVFQNMLMINSVSNVLTIMWLH